MAHKVLNSGDIVGLRFGLLSPSEMPALDFLQADTQGPAKAHLQQARACLGLLQPPPLPPPEQVALATL
eukprot:12286529-Alexandrium_andersonii.AAC.1